MALFASSLSGLNAASWLLVTAAGNVANLNSEGYRAKRVGFAANADGTVKVESPQDTGPEPAEGGSNVDLATELVSTMVGNTYFASNAAALRAQDQVLGAALDLKA